MKTDIKNFMFYLITEPFIQIYNSIKYFLIKLEPFGKPKGWVYLFGFFFISSLIIKNYFLSKIFLVLAILSGLKYLWDRPEWRARAKQRILKKGYKKVEDEQNGGLDNNKG